MKKIIAMLLAMLMIIPSAVLISRAEGNTALDNFNKYWRVSAMKWQSQGEYKHIGDFYKMYYAENGYQPLYEMTDEGGVRLTALTYDQAPGAMSSQLIGSKVKCPLDGVEVKLRFDDFVMNRLVNLGSTIYVLWCTEEIGGDVDGYYNDYFNFCQGMEQAFYVGQNGMRDSMPMGSKGLSICISGSGANQAYLGQQIAGGVSISCFDGEYVNKNDGHLGKRWTFGYRTGDVIQQPAERIDFSDGLTIRVRPDEKLGYVVGVEDSSGFYKEYYDTSKVSYFPDLPGTGNNWTIQEPDFSCLKGLYGYLYIGASASAKTDMNIFTVESVNGKSMDSENQLHTHTPDGNVVTEQEFPCKEGITFETCTECGERCNIKTAATTAEHDWGDFTVDEEPTCIPGKQHRICRVCGDAENTEIDPIEEHSPGGWNIKTVPTDNKDGVMVKYCRKCGGEVETKDYKNPFTDVKSDDWFAKYVMFNSTRGYVTGMSEDSFVPGTNLTRAQFVTILAGVDGADLSKFTGNTPFSDVEPGKWYAKYVQWANENGIVSGISEAQFAPEANVTREQIALMYMKYAEKKGLDVIFDENELDGYTDKDTVSSWAKNAVCWAVGNGLISGISENILSPGSFATRAQVATINMGFVLNLLEK